MTAGSTSPLRILLVDDHPLVRDGLRARLQADGYVVTAEAGAPESAMQALLRDQPDLVLMDVGLKGSSTNGIELAAQMLQRRPGLAVLMFSMYDNPEYVQRALQAGARGYVLKDASGDELLAAIEAIRAGGTFLSPGVTRRMFRAQAPKPILTPRESEILSALARGESSKQIARALDLSVRTVETHRQNIKRKLELDSPAELMRYALEHARNP
ncbi:response regulator [Azohydromonas lata]|uniref:Response regulator transcription factor n=1 Tax=Azohydromonas lata TaxID=45677 RepID=A0ABU5IMM2_9BURK|nr:response regulator transcription factor [Azohydromonas lata]MDZ5460140.1 response regulator transcription factor [Azohydromonas lata]